MDNQILTKTELLDAMDAYGACADATDYVTDRPDGATAREIWLGCDRADWLVWFGSRHRPAALQAFAYGCADRAVRVYAADALAAAGSVAEAWVLRALAPIVDSTTARAGEKAVERIGFTDAAYDDVTTKCARAAYLSAHCDDADNVAFFAVRAAVAFAPYEAECRIQLGALHALADAVLLGA